MAGRDYAAGRVILAATGVPLLVVELGIWEQGCAAFDRLELERQRNEPARAVRWPDDRIASSREVDMQFRFRSEGQVHADEAPALWRTPDNLSIRLGAPRPEAMMLPGLDRPITWEDVVDLDMVLDRGASAREC